ncbi:NIPSNAP family protein [Teichococcus vastitatis]|uniref:NIPSNAP family protein n=1 Tax=Teichococcus vastitatis TaxID=2307076 RepID=A0ABS9W8S2_9PROT|nr:NIPSNAP family protein [Pseudoroseomonas vastitatis]MCI0755688.1 NIPSNAP family protein [Pseudoroseomonas vastitatis]
MGARQPEMEVSALLIDHRTYTVKPGTLKKHMALYAEHGFEVQKRHLGEPLAYLLTETGDVNSYVHIWAYESAADRAQKRAALQADPAWSAYLEKSAAAGYLIRQENKLMLPVPFAPIKR